MSDLMLIESPNKIKTISKYVQEKNLTIYATYGHVRDLAKWNFGFNIKDLTIKWTKVSKKTKKGSSYVDIIDEINKAADKSEKIYLSTDPDREGEAIAWHIYSVLSKKNQSKCIRIVFNEITKQGIEKAFANPRQLDQNQINSYLARRLLDRYIGFKLSSYTYKKIGGISAGRVQSIALKFLKDKEEEILNFVPDHWFKLETLLENNLPLNLKKLSPIHKNLKLRDDLKGDSLLFSEQKDIEFFKSTLNNEFSLFNIGKEVIEKIKPPSSFETSTFLETAINKLKISSKVAEKSAQSLYEGVEINNETISLITYPRTDRSDFSEQFLADAQKYIEDIYSSKYWQGQVKPKKTEELVQGAHEGIRPTDIFLTPDKVKQYLESTQYRVYELIWVYTVCSLMSPSQQSVSNCQFENNKNIFSGILRHEVFDGYRVIMKNYGFQVFAEELKISREDIEKQQKFKIKNLEIKTINKKPPAPYNEATLISALKEKGIGRPSTYTSISNVVLNRHYAKKEQSKLLITELGLKVSRDLENNFQNFIHYDYTKNMEKSLDDISESKLDWKEFLHKVFDDFSNNLTKAMTTIKEKEVEFVDNEFCDKCKEPLVYKFNRKTQSKFIACSKFPDCDFSKSLEPIKEVGKTCPDCSKSLVEKINRWKSKFIACSGYPECKYIENAKKPEILDELCSKCNSPLVKRKNRWNAYFIACSGYPKCKFIKSEKIEKETPSE